MRWLRPLFSAPLPLTVGFHETRISPGRTYQGLGITPGLIMSIFHDFPHFPAPFSTFSVSWLE